jgi:hypothetical protein
MSQKLSATLSVLVGLVLVIAGSRLTVSTAPDMAAALDAGLSSECAAKLVTCPVRFSDSERAMLEDAGISFPRSSQRYARISTLAFDCSAVDGGLVVPLLAKFGVVQANSPALQVVQKDACVLSACDSLCAAATPIRVETPTCRVPDCRTADGGWDEAHAPVDCLSSLGGAPAWRGCNVIPSAYASGAQCVPVECAAFVGDGLGAM